ncbi:hypothetical protein GH714_007924 [Hevea brasiliensis]|uniref:Fe2OG dioxygenase domain-containing protein n=1 Tax=Hevea brasiliensis TaxID=3981 RepID=A0A6A6KYP5_HEVBR|nr:hypothetical protein GH714_007924 [Hevea brasiliensis]
MSNWDNDPKVAESVCEAAEKFGFFQLVNHGVPLEVLDGVKDAPIVSLGCQQRRRGSTPKSFPLPTTSESQVLCTKLMTALMEKLNVKEIDETKESLLMGSKRINLNYYPRCPNPQLTVGVGRHSDVSSLTFLLQDEIGGLYVRVNEGKGEEDGWVHVPPIEGSLVINVGDALQILSNGRYKSVEHCVIASGSKNRISIPIFVNPKPNDVIGPLPELIAAGEKPKYKNILYSDYVKHFFRKAHDGKKTVAFAEISS